MIILSEENAVRLRTSVTRSGVTLDTTCRHCDTQITPIRSAEVSTTCVNREKIGSERKSRNWHAHCIRKPTRTCRRSSGSCSGQPWWSHRVESCWCRCSPLASCAVGGAKPLRRSRRSVRSSCGARSGSVLEFPDGDGEWEARSKTVRRTAGQHGARPRSDLRGRASVRLSVDAHDR